ncbi:acyl-CoA dehydrogenase family protein [Rhodococcus qingshengii]|uniref:acyl-CoA dehydrogenase family protein n=1 Tax=Rhodococcus qingshengii TaxID=334542 RepID=UPI001E3C6324|nr:acyl-CoA dehydrogenase family protein [Rhodococcus qingshengii]MCQ4150588.1 acyl-CoA dehydrogenase family protein [Rhodococcus qingshengii]UGQ55424.1 acyl-CoA dehydrogenase family protein [Rhodococcus qingshengii]
MDIVDSPERSRFRTRVRNFIQENLPPGWEGLAALPPDQQAEFTANWRILLHENDLLAVSWPKEYGGAGLTPSEQIVVAEELTRAGVPHGNFNDNFSIQMLGSTLLRVGTQEQKEYYLPRILTREDIWCQGFSEPEAGSDLAGIRTTAELSGDRWIINGQKTWTSYGHLADHIFVLCRTDKSVRAHNGMSLLLVKLDQPGIEIRPLLTMTGDHEFNEVFFTDAHCAAADVLGPVNAGWGVAMTLLGYERGEAAATLPVKFRADFERLTQLARDYGKADDPVIRQRLGRCIEGVEQMKNMGLRAVSQWVNGEDIGAESSLHKLFWSEWLQEATQLAMDIMGPAALTPEGLGLQGISFPAAEAGTPNTTGAWTDYYMRSRAATIYAGSSEIQRNIISERLLGLPRK